MLDLRRRRGRRARVHDDHRVGPRHPQRQHDHHRPRRHARPGPAVPAARPRRALVARVPTPTCCTGSAASSPRIARKRLQAIFNASELGAGFQIALSDLEIRGAGNILGAEQHGHMAAVGFDLYTRLLAEAVEEQGACATSASRSGRGRRRSSTCRSTPTCPTTTSPRSRRSWSCTDGWAGRDTTGEVAAIRRAGRPLRRRCPRRWSGCSRSRGCASRPRRRASRRWRARATS